MKFIHKLLLWLMMGLALGTFIFGILQFMGQAPADAGAPGSDPVTNLSSAPERAPAR